MGLGQERRQGCWLLGWTMQLWCVSFVGKLRVTYMFPVSKVHWELSPGIQGLEELGVEER